MLNFFEKLPNIYIVLSCFVILMLIWLGLLTLLFRLPIEANPKIIDLTTAAITGVFTLANTALGAVIGLAMKTNKAPSNTINTETIESAEITAKE